MIHLKKTKDLGLKAAEVSQPADGRLGVGEDVLKCSLCPKPRLLARVPHVISRMEVESSKPG